MFPIQVRRAGGIEALIGVLRADPASPAARTVATALANLCDNNAVNLTQVRQAGGISALVAVLLTGPDNDAVEQVNGVQTGP
jgi:hypothetical protein